MLLSPAYLFGNVLLRPPPTINRLAPTGKQCELPFFLTLVSLSISLCPSFSCLFLIALWSLPSAPGELSFQNRQSLFLSHFLEEEVSETTT
jgi:hypothetical protein